jgi:hypothetical protein
MNKACHLCIPLGPPQMALSLADPGNPGRCPLTAMVAIARMCRRAGCVLLARLQQAFERRCFIKESQTLQGQLKHGLSRLCQGSSSRGGVSTCIRRHRRRQIQRAPESVSPKPVLRSRAARLPSHAMCHVPCANWAFSYSAPNRAPLPAASRSVVFYPLSQPCRACFQFACRLWVFDRCATDMSTHAKTGLRKEPVARSPQFATAAP